ncbi:MAG: hydrogenase expression/formation protein HypC [Acidobacteriota bacterium]|jgi:hydrogenase expression/formation protein HypC|nr:hydrogenase expression/formation protein HypC [Acidobacteriota bacterium]
MCLGIPGEIVSISGLTAVIEFWGTRKQVHLDVFAGTLLPGDFVIEHDGTIVRRVAPDDVNDTLALYETVMGEA